MKVVVLWMVVVSCEVMGGVEGAEVCFGTKDGWKDWDDEGGDGVGGGGGGDGRNGDDG